MVGLKRPTSFQRTKQVTRQDKCLVEKEFFIGELSMLVFNDEVLNMCRFLLGNCDAKHS